MFALMQSRWLYVSDKFLLGEHPETKKLILMVKSGNGIIPPIEVERVLSLNQVELDGPLQVEGGIQYYELREVKDESNKASSSGVSG